MTLLSVVKDVCAVVGVNLPLSVFTNITNNRTMQEMLALSNEMAQRIAYDTRDWTRLKLTATYNGDGSKTAFDLPANYKRMLLTANVYRSNSPQQAMRFIPDTDEWLRRRASNQSDSWGEWTILGGQMIIYPAMAVGVNAYFAYMDKNCIKLNSGGSADLFANDADTYLLDERCLKLGMIWQWKAQKGSPYQEDMGTYGDALTNVMGRDSPSPIIRQTVANNLWPAAGVSYPYPVP